VEPTVTTVLYILKRSNVQIMAIRVYTRYRESNQFLPVIVLFSRSRVIACLVACAILSADCLSYT